MRMTESRLRRIIRTEARTLLEKRGDAPADDLSKEDVLPLELDKVDPELAKVMVRAGVSDRDPNDDKVEVSPASFPAASLKPAQTTMVLDKAIGMALGMCIKGNIGGDLGAVISADNHIMDGHHRWAATIMADPNGTVSGYQASLPGQELIPVLNLLTKGLFGKMKGNPGTGSIDDFTYDNVKAKLEKYVASGTPGKFGMKPEIVQQALTNQFGSVEEGIEQMASNVEQLNKDVPGWAPDRVQMPVIDPREVPKAASVLNKGQVDVSPPFAAVTKKASDKSSKKTQKESVERWQRLAGLIKG